MSYEPVNRRERTLWLILFWVGVVTTCATPFGFSILLAAWGWWLIDPSVRLRKIAEEPPVTKPPVEPPPVEPPPVEPPPVEPPVTEPPPPPPLRPALLRGIVRHRDGAPLAGVVVSLVGAPDRSSAPSGPDGAWTLTVERGGYVVVRFTATGFLPSQRRVSVVRPVVPVRDVALVPIDPAVTPVRLVPGAPMQVARGTKVSDVDGERTPTLLFPSGTRATVVHPDGSVAALENLSIRATEYTAGPHGPAAMPAELPTGVAYTYCVELSADEAAGAELRFDRPVIHYIENFIGFPVGGRVPVGWYDAGRATWIPSPNGRVVRVIGVDDGLATLDVDGTGQPAASAALDALGVDETERRHLAGLYGAGQTLWRVPVPHFSPWDCNWPFGPPKGAQPPPDEPPRPPSEEDPCPQPGSIIEPRNQALGERVPIPGTPYALVHWSRRGRAYAPARTVEVPLVGETPPELLRRVEVEAIVAGRRITDSFAPTPHATWRFVWDGLDAGGQPCAGPEDALIRVGYTYEGVYREPAGTDASFAVPSGVELTGTRTRQEVTLWREWPVVLGQDTRGDLFPRWQLDVLHAYDRETERLSLGDGRITRARGRSGFEQIDGIRNAHDAVVAPNGSLLVVEGYEGAVRRVRPDDRLETLATGLDAPRRIALGPDGEVYVAERGRIVRVARDGALTPIAGGGSPRSWRKDGALATDSFLFEPSRLALASDGSIYVAERADGVCIRRVCPNGRMQTIFSSEVASLDAGACIVNLVGDADGIAHALVSHTVDEPGADRLVGWSIERFEPGRAPAVLLRRDAGQGNRGDAPIDVVGALPGAALVTVRTGGNVEVFRITPDGRQFRHVTIEIEDVRGTADGTLFVRVGSEWRRVAPDGTVTAGPTLDETTYIEEISMGPDGTVCAFDRFGTMIRFAPEGGKQIVGQWVYPDWENDDAEGPIVVPLPESGVNWLPRVGVDGSLYVLDDIRSVIHRVDPEGRPAIVAGVLPSVRRLGDGAPATTAVLPDKIGALTVGPDGAVYFAHRRAVRRVGTDGNLSTIAWCWPYERRIAAYYPDGFGLKQSVIALKATPAGDLVIASGEGAVRLGAAGIQPIVAFAADTRLPSTLPVAPMYPRDVRIGDDGRLLLLRQDEVVVRLDASGRKTWETSLAATNLVFNSLAEGEGGELYLVGNGVWRPKSGTSMVIGFVVPSPDGDEEHVFDPGGRHLYTLDARTGTTLMSFEYEDGRLSRIIEGGAITRIEWQGDRATIVAPSGARTEAVLTGGALAGLTLPGGAELRFTYERGLLASYRDARGATHRFTYDADGRLLDDEDGEGGRTSLRRTELPNGFELMTTSALGVTITTRVERLPSGETRVRKICCGGGVTETLTRDGLRITTLPDGSVVTIETPTAVSDRVEVKTTLEAASRRVTRTITWEEPSDGEKPCLVQRSAIEGHAAEATEIRPSRIVTTTPAGRRAEVAIDRDAGTVALRLGGGPPVRLALRDGATVEATLGERRVEVRRDALGRPTAIVGPDGTIELDYDALGQLVERRIGGTPTRFEYDRAGDLVALSPPGRPAHRFEYTRLGQLARYVPPGAADGETTGYGYDADSRLATIRLPRGGTVELAHDGAGRLASVRTPDDRIEYTYAAGTLARIAGPAGIDLRYRHEGSFPVEETWDGPVRGTVTWITGDRFRRAGTRVNDEAPVRLAYDADDLLVGAGELTLERGPDGALRATRIGGLADAWTHDALGQPEGYRATHADRDLFAVRWVRDVAGRIVEEHETVAGRARIRHYAYDAAGRLTSDGDTTWRYDANGNRLEEEGAGVRRMGRYDDRDRLLAWGAVRFEHDAAGAVARRIDGERVTRYGWDAFSQLTRVELPGGRVVEYLFDGQNRRIGRKVDGRLVQGWLYDGGPAPVAELDASSTVVARFVYGTRAHVPDYLRRDGRAFRLVTDGRGSVRLVVDVETGTIAQEIDYDAFGRVLRDTHPGFQPFGFAGGVQDPLTRLVHCGSRSYDPETGRWLSPDPTLFAGGTNLYAYADGDPVNRIDPAGTVPLAVLLPAIAGLVGAGLGAFGESLKENPDCRDYLSAMVLGFSIGAVGTGAGLILEVAGMPAFVAGAYSSLLSSYLQVISTMESSPSARSRATPDIAVGTAIGMVTGGLAGKLFPTRHLSPQELGRMLGRWRMPKSVPQSNRVGHFKPDTWNRIKGTGYGGAAGGAAGAAWNALRRAQTEREQGSRPPADAERTTQGSHRPTWAELDRILESWRRPNCC